MSRLLLGIVILVVAATALAMPPPDPELDPLSGVVIDRPGIESPLDASIWYCPWSQATSQRDSVISLMSLSPARAEASFPVLITGEPADTAEADLEGPGAASLTLSDIAQRGHSPGFIEFTGGPSGAGVTVTGDILAADTCVAFGGDEWFFVGGSTMTGDELTLRLFNPFPESAQVAVSAFSEIGVEALGNLATVGVGARSWHDIDFADLLRQRQSLVVSVRLRTGLVIPAMSFARGADAAWWSGTGLSTDWEIPIARVSAEDETFIVVANPGVAEVVADIELYGTQGAQRELFTVAVAPGSPLRLDLADVEQPVVAARVSAPAPLAAGSVTVGPAGTAVTAGVPERGRTWLLPGAGGAGGRDAALWLLNSGEEALVVTISRITASEVFNSNEILEPGVVTRLPAVGSATLGYLVRSTDPFTASWTVHGETGMAHSTGLLVPEDG